MNRRLKGIAMNAKLLFSTMALAVASTCALADEAPAPVSRATVIADYQHAARAGNSTAPTTTTNWPRVLRLARRSRARRFSLR
jgi:hypothetical protein